MRDLFGKCGFNCGGCPWGQYARKDMDADEFEQFRKRCKEILGYKPTRKPCLTCQTSNEKMPKGAKLPPRSCLIRQCVDKIGVENCAYCSRYPCEYVKEHGSQWNREYFEEKLGRPISDVDYLTFIEPFEGLKNLEAIRASLSPEDIAEAAAVPALKTKIVDFPEDLPFSDEETMVLKKLHQMLARVKRSSLVLADTDTFAQQQRLKDRRAHLLRFLWILGHFGGFRKENGAHLIVDAATYEANRGSEKMLAIWSFVKDRIFKILLELGVRCERVALEGVKEKDLTTGTGYLRGKGWVMKMSFDESAGGVDALKTLQNYAARLDEEYGKKAFRYFSDVDMRMLNKN